MFYGDPDQCPDSMVEYIFRAAPQSKEGIPLLAERISILRQNGEVLCKVELCPTVKNNVLI